MGGYVAIALGFQSNQQSINLMQTFTLPDDVLHEISSDGYVDGQTRTMQGNVSPDLDPNYLTMIIFLNFLKKLIL